MSRDSLRRLLVVGAALAVCVGGSAAGCGSEDDGMHPGVARTSASGAGGSPAASTAVSSTAISTGTLGGASPGWGPPGPPPDACDPKPNPDGIPDGWVEDLDWACQCRLYRPPSKELLPSPIQWEPCGGGLPDGIACRQMVTEWSEDPGAIALLAAFDRNPDGTGALSFRRVGSSAAIDLVANVDGPVRSAIAFPRTAGVPDCWESPTSFHEGRIVATMLGDSYTPPSSEAEGLIGGSADALQPQVLFRYHLQAS